MKKILHFILFILLTFNCFSQNKKEYYYDADFNRVSEKEFRKIRKANINYVLPKIIENDTAIVGKLFYRKSYGKLSAQNRISFINLLNKIVDSKVDTTHAILISFIYKNERDVVGFYEKNRNRFKSIKKSKEYKHFFFTEKGYVSSAKKIKVYEDEHDLISRMFFKYKFKMKRLL